MSKRHLPLFVTISVMWSAVLLTCGPSRTVVLSLDPRMKPFALDDAPLALRAALTVLDALASAWIVVRILVWRRTWRSPGQVVGWTFILAWFAVVSWSVVMLLAKWLIHADSVMDIPLALLSAVFISLAAVPSMAFLAFPQATWILLPLALATVILVRKFEPGMSDETRAVAPGQSTEQTRGRAPPYGTFLITVGPTMRAIHSGSTDRMRRGSAMRGLSGLMLGGWPPCGK
jgi:hypothetical protein